MTEPVNEAAARLADYFDPGGFPGFTLDANTAWTSEQVKAVLDHHRKFLRQIIEPDVHTVLAENQQLREQRDSAHRSVLSIGESLARLAAFQLADNAEDTAWNIVRVHARQLLAAGLLPPTPAPPQHNDTPEAADPDLSNEPIGEIDD